MSSAKAFLLKCGIQKYEWGKLGKASEVAQLASCSDKDFKIEENIPYAELWMGTHPRGPSVVSATGQLLSKWIEEHPDSLGSKAPKLFADSVGQLPFLFKILSVNKSLSIQTHPSKKAAERLHKENPKEYPDSNHKPEMAIALTPFEALCGFRPKKEIVEFLKCVPEFRSVVGETAAAELSKGGSAADQASLKKCFTALMSSKDDLVKEQLSHLVSRLQKAKVSQDSATLVSCQDELLLRLYDQFPGDVGCFAIYFLNVMTLKIGEAIFLEADLPHAYLYGDCLECMACSDNVVRAGLTPKYKDIATLCSLLKYDCKAPKDLLFKGHKSSDDPYVTVFNPPVEDFSVHQIQLPQNIHQYVIRPVDGASILIVIKGSGDAASQSLGTTSLHLERGSVVFLAANESLTLHMKSSDQQMVIYRACCDGSV